MKRLFAIYLVLMIVIFVFASCDNKTEQTMNEASETAATTAPAQNNIIKIGVVEPTTGINSNSGKLELLGIKFANLQKDTVIIDGKKYKITLEIQDDKSSYAAAEKAGELFAAENVAAVIGSHSSIETSAVAQILSKKKTAVVGATCTALNLTKKGGNFFRLCPTSYSQAKTLASYAYNDLGLKKAYVISNVGDDDDRELALFFSQIFSSLGGKVTEADIETNTKDFSPLIKEAKKQKCDMVFAAFSDYYAESFISQAYEGKLSVPIIAGAKWDTKTALEAAWNYDAKLYAASFAKENDSEFYYKIREWINNDDEALKLNGGDLTISSATVLGYDAYSAVIKAIETAGSTDPAKILKAIPSISYTGVSAKLNFDSSGSNKNAKVYIKKADIVNAVWK